VARTSRLLFAHERSGDSARGGDVVFECEDGIPLGWLLCFGGRNFWNPDDQVADRGGTAAQRDRFETPLDVADARLSQAIDVLRGCPHLWVWLAPVDPFLRRLQSRGKRGFLRLEAPWADAALLNSLPAYVENYVNLVVASRLADIARVAAPIEKVSPFVPVCHSDDRKRFDRSPAYRNQADLRRVAALVVGLPADDAETWHARLDLVAAPAYARLANLPPYPAAPRAATAGAPTETSSFMARLKNLVGKKT